MFDQISIFLENSRGQLAGVTGILAREGIDIRALNIAESSDYGVLRIITNDAGKTVRVLSENGFIASESDVVGLRLEDRPGSLCEALTILSDNNLDISYMYSIFSQVSGSCFMIMKLADPVLAERILTEKGLSVATKEELFIE